jgi:uncharacterized protein DUF2846
MRRFSPLLAALFILTATCATFGHSHKDGTQMPSAEKTTSPNVTVCFYRPQRYIGWIYKPSIYVGETEITRLRNGESVVVIVPAGNFQIYSNDKSTGVDLDAKPGQTYYVRLDMKKSVWGMLGAITLVDPQEGKFEFMKQPLDLTRNLSGQSNPPASAGAPTPST